jgi:hypothetical protein
MSSAGVRVGAGTRFRYDGETVEVIEMAITATGNEVVLKDHHGRLMRLAVRELLLSDRARVIARGLPRWRRKESRDRSTCLSGRSTSDTRTRQIPGKRAGRVSPSCHLY